MKRIPEARRGPLWWLAGALLLVAAAWQNWPADWLQTDFLALLPTLQDQQWQRRAEDRQSQAFDRRLVLRVTAPEQSATAPASDPEKADRYLRKLIETLADSGFTGSDLLATEQARWRRLGSALQPWRFALLTEPDRQALQNDPGQVLAQYRRYLYSPMGGAGLSRLREDPVGTFARFITAAAPGLPSNSGATAVLELDSQSIALKRLEALYPLYMELKSRAEQRGLELQATGSPLYSAYGTGSARSEISTIGLASFTLLTLLLYRALRSWRALLLTLLCVGSGLACGLLLSVLLLGRIHLLALVFGATLIGIAADYALHYLSHSLAPDWQRERPLAAVGRALGLSALSSVLAFAALALLPFPGLSQIGVIMAGGLAGSFATVCLLFPAFYRVPPGRSLPQWCRLPTAGPRRSRVLLALVALACLPGLALLSGGDDVRSFYAAPDALENDRQAITAASHHAGDSHYLLVTGSSVETLLATEAALRAELKAATTGISALIPSAAQQRQNYALWLSLLESGLLQQHVEALGLRPADQSALFAALSQPPPLLAPQDLNQIELPLGLNGFLGCEGGECASRVQLAGELSAQDRQRIDGFTGAVLVEPVARVNQLLSQYRYWLVILLPAAGLLVALVLSLALGWRRALWAAGLPACACLFSLGVLGYLQGQFGLVNLLALLLVLGVGLDYGIFRTATAPAEQAANTLAITLSALTSILAFGMLALSATPFIASFGLSIALGLAAAFGLSWLRPDDPEASRP